jgi:hypothetical protein
MPAPADSDHVREKSSGFGEDSFDRLVVVHHNRLCIRPPSRERASCAVGRIVSSALARRKTSPKLARTARLSHGDRSNASGIWPGRFDERRQYCVVARGSVYPCQNAKLTVRSSHLASRLAATL